LCAALNICFLAKLRRCLLYDGLPTCATLPLLYRLAGPRRPRGPNLWEEVDCKSPGDKLHKMPEV